MQETGSYDKALEQAGIQDFNIMPYTSVMPPESHEILQRDAASHYSHGAVLETIMAQINGVKVHCRHPHVNKVIRLCVQQFQQSVD